ncbi:MAG TPA: hypothetical protein VKT72_08535 [Candidatus Baltobacteraceae bacterium]|nr:hypothetical protein [Candidatus Baltobacteraceae bacterium]
MSQVVFGPHATGLSIFGMHIPLVNTEVVRGDGGSVPSNLKVTGTGPLGQTNSCTVSNGATMTVSGIGSLNVVYLISDCRTVPASGTVPEHFVFRITLRAEGTVSVKLIPIPINIQVDSFEVTIATNAAVNDNLRTAGFALA